MAAMTVTATATYYTASTLDRLPPQRQALDEGPPQLDISTRAAMEFHRLVTLYQSISLCIHAHTSIFYG